MNKEKEKRSAGRPKELPIEAVKINITLHNNHVVWLDRLSTDIRSRSMKIVDRGAIIRAILNAVQTSNINLRDFKTEQEIGKAVLSIIKAYQP